MKPAEWLQEIKKMRFEEAYTGWTERRLTQEDAARLLGVCARTFRRYIDRYEEEGLDGLVDKCLTQVSHRRAPVDEVLRLLDRYRRRHDGWSVKHYYAWYRRDGGTRSYNWVKNAVKKAAKRGAHRKRREPAPWAGMLMPLWYGGDELKAHAWFVGLLPDGVTLADPATGAAGAVVMLPPEAPPGAVRAVPFDIVLIDVVTVVLAGGVGTGGIRQAERQVVAGKGADRGVGLEAEGQAAVLAAHPAVRIQPVAVVVAGLAVWRRDRAVVRDAEKIAQGVAAHGPVEGTVELGEIDGRCQYEINQVGS